MGGAGCRATPVHDCESGADRLGLQPAEEPHLGRITLKFIHKTTLKTEQRSAAGTLREQFLDDVSGHICEAEVATLVTICQPRVIDSEQMQHRRMQVVDMNRSFN